MNPLHSLRQLPDGSWEAQFYGRKATGETREAALANLEASMPRIELSSYPRLPPEALDQLLDGLDEPGSN